MKLPDEWRIKATQETLLEEQIRFFRMVNGLLAGVFFVSIALAIYKIMGLFL